MIKILMLSLCTLALSLSACGAYDGRLQGCANGIYYAPHKRAHGSATDIRLTCYGANNTNVFINSPHLIRQCVGSLMTAAYDSGGKVKGINLYFPDFDFSRKRDMAQLAKSVSLVADSLPFQHIRNLSLYFSFDAAVGSAYRSYLCALTHMADSVLLVGARGDMVLDVLDHS
ncbi:MAG: hypothetical protein LBU92_05750, partial [Prevotellaceae bacterium]|nr:hypothetical protein [Prevotellaceae bacterium]